jgi:hypothetical protein
MFLHAIPSHSHPQVVLGAHLTYHKCHVCFIDPENYGCDNNVIFYYVYITLFYPPTLGDQSITISVIP